MRVEGGCAAALGLVIILVPSGQREARVEPRALAPPATVIPFRLVAGFLVVVDGSIGGLDQLSFVIDTGTSRTVIHQGIARTLGLARTRQDMLVFGGDVATEGVVAPSLAFGRIRALDLQVLTADLHSQEGRLGLRPDALIGMDVLRHHCVTIDYAAANITFGCTGGWHAQASFDPESLYPVLEASIDGAAYRLIVDSASEAIVIFEHAIPPDKHVEVDAEVEATHLTGTVLLKRFTAARFGIGRHGLGTPPVFIISSTSEVPGFDGVLGSQWLPGTQVHFDFPRRVLGWK